MHWIQLLRMYHGFLIEQAKRKRSPETYAEFVLDVIEDNMPAALDEITKAAQGPTFTDDVLTAVPELAPHREWINEFLTNIRDMLNESDDEPDQGETSDIPAGDTNNV